MTASFSLSRVCGAAAMIMCVDRSALAQDEVAVVEPVKVEASFSTTLERHSDIAIREMVIRFENADELRRAAELSKSNQNVVTNLLELAALPKWIPFGLGASENHVGTFFQQNYVRPDLNPRAESVLFSR